LGVMTIRYVRQEHELWKSVRLHWEWRE